MLVSALIVLRLPADYFSRSVSGPLRNEQHPILRWTIRIVKNVVGVVIAVVGIVLTLPGVPGPGILTILLGLMMMDFPGKRRFERWLITRIAALQVPLDIKQIVEAASTRVTEITGRASEDFELIVEDGTPQALILQTAEEWMADLIVMGSHGRTSASEVLIGSVTDSVIRHAHCPVLIVRPGGQTKRIVAGTDFSDPALPALKAAADEVVRIGGELTVVHSLDLVWSPAAYPAMAFGGAPFEVGPEKMAELQRIATERLEEALRQLNVAGETVVTTGSAGQALIDVATERTADL